MPSPESAVLLKLWLDEVEQLVAKYRAQLAEEMSTGGDDEQPDRPR